MKDLLLKLMPEEDKLQRFYIGAILALVLGFILNPFIVFMILVIVAFAWEIARDQLYSIKLDYWDIFFGVLPAFLLLISFIIK